MQRYSEVDFSSPQNVQILYNEHIYNTIIMFNDSKLELKFTEENNLLSGACVVLTESNYKITYKDMTFKGEFSQLTDSFLPCVIYRFIRSFENGILLESYDEERACYFVKRDSNGCFVILECYETDENKVYSIEIK